MEQSPYSRGEALPAPLLSVERQARQRHRGWRRDGLARFPVHGQMPYLKAQAQLDVLETMSHSSLEFIQPHVVPPCI
jgi:hypothetical protein